MTDGADHSKIVRAQDYRWQGVDVHEYKAEGTHFRDITRQTLLGEGADEQSLNFVTRYFEIQPGGYSTLERHDHPHSVVVLRGTGEVILHDRVATLAPHDVVYVSPQTVHQFHAVGDEPLGFLCVVDRNRDRPQLPDDDEAAALARVEAVGRRMRR